MRGDTVIMEAIEMGSPRPASSDETLHKINVELKRFADTKNISVLDLRALLSFNNPEKKMEAFDKLIGKKQGQIKNKFTATKEYMRLGAMRGEVKDGSGKTLFKFKDENIAPLALNSNINPESKFEEYEDDLVKEFGYVPDYEMLVDRTIFNGMWNYAESKNLAGKSVKKVKDEGRTCIDYNGRIVRPVTNAYPDKFGNKRAFFENGSGLFVPIGTDAFQEFYTYAVDKDAMDGEPQEYFSKIKEKDDDSGVDVIGESVAIPINTRPYSVREVTWN
jgi:hypothetical protein